MDKHEYMIWRAVTKYDLLYDKTSGASEDNVEEMIDEKERDIIKLLPNFFIDKEKEQVVDFQTRILSYWILFTEHSEKFDEWRDGKLLYCGSAWQYYEKNEEERQIWIRDRRNPNLPFYIFYRWKNRPLQSYYDIIKGLRNTIQYKDFPFDDITKVKTLFRNFDILSYRDIDIIQKVYRLRREETGDASVPYWDCYNEEQTLDDEKYNIFMCKCHLF